MTHAMRYETALRAEFAVRRRQPVRLPFLEHGTPGGQW